MRIIKQLEQNLEKADNITGEYVLQELKDGHKRFQSGHSIHPHATETRLEEIFKKQRPHAAILSCSDSRVPIELILDAGFGDLFVIRNAGAACTEGSLASLEYAAIELDVKVILIMSHQNCGAITAACSPEFHLSKSLDNLIGNIRKGLNENNIGNSTSSEDIAYACRKYPKITKTEVLRESSKIKEKYLRKELIITEAYYKMDPHKIEWL